MRKVMTIVGTRPELIKMCRVIDEFDRQFDHILVHTGQNYDFELNQVFFDELGIRKPDYFLGAAGATASQTIAQVIAKSEEVMIAEKPEAIMIYGDTNSGIAVIPAKRHKIPTFHMEAGNRCFDQRVPEELNRKVIDHLSDINMVLTEHARRYLIAEGIRQETIIKTGSHMREVLDHFMPQIKASNVLAEMGLEAGRYFLVSAHREENVDSPEALTDLVETLDALTRGYGMPVIVSTHPRTRKRLEELGNLPVNTDVRFLKPFGFFDYNNLQMNAYCTLSDSGTITEEASLLRLPAVTLRNAHERPEGMDVGTLVMCGLKKDQVLDAVTMVTEQHHREGMEPTPVQDYESPRVARQVSRIVASYIDYVNRTVWRKG
jgi:UDP-N-acetylglucosamine 2-epimerase